MAKGVLAARHRKKFSYEKLQRAFEQEVSHVKDSRLHCPVQGTWCLLTLCESLNHRMSYGRRSLRRRSLRHAAFHGPKTRPKPGQSQLFAVISRSRSEVEPQAASSRQLRPKGRHVVRLEFADLNRFESFSALG